MKELIWRSFVAVFCLVGSISYVEAQQVRERQLSSADREYCVARDRRLGCIVVWQNDPKWVSHLNSTLRLKEENPTANAVTQQTNLLDNTSLRTVLKEHLLQNGEYTTEEPLSGEFVIVKYERPLRNEEAMCKDLMDSGLAWYAVPDYLFAPQAVPNDPYYSSYQWHHTKVNSSNAWNYETGSVLIAVCDSGFEVDHPDLAGNLHLPGYNSVDGSSDVSPINWHGTAVAGVLGAVGNNGLFVAGMAWNCRIIPVRITNRSDGIAYFTDMRKGIEEAARRGAKVVNLSYEGCHRWEINLAGEYLRERGGLLVVCANNEGVEKSWPDYSSFIAVGATDQNDNRAVFPIGGSNWGSFIDVVAPGLDICTLNLNGQVSTGAWGTSFSSPIVAGIAALLWSRAPSLTPTEVENLIFDSCVDIGAPGSDNVFGRGRVDAGAALTRLVERGAVPVVGDFDGDGNDDLATYRDTCGYWRFLNSSGGNLISEFGYNGTAAVAGDFDGDGTDDYGLYDADGLPGYASPGSWYFMQSQSGFATASYGYAGTVPVIGNFDGDSMDDYGLYDADGLPGVVNPGAWYIMRSTLGHWQTSFGYAGTLPLAPDLDGDGVADRTLYDNLDDGIGSPGKWYSWRSVLGWWSTSFGYAGVVPVVGDFDGDGKDDYGIYDHDGVPGHVAAGTWSVMRSQAGFRSYQFGYAGTVPVVGNFDGDGRDDYGVYDPASATWYLMMSTAGYRSFYSPTGEHPLAP